MTNVPQTTNCPEGEYILYSRAKMPTAFGEVDFCVFNQREPSTRRKKEEGNQQTGDSCQNPRNNNNQNAIAIIGKGGEEALLLAGSTPPGVEENGEGMQQHQPVLVRVHDACITSEAFGSLKCDCKDQLDLAMNIIAQEGGLVIYLPQEGRGIGLGDKIAAYGLQATQGLDTVDANRALGLPDDARTYAAARDILNHFRIKKLTLLSNNPRKVEMLTNLGIQVAGTRPCIVVPKSAVCRSYMETKAKRMDHDIALLGDD